MAIALVRVMCSWCQSTVNKLVGYPKLNAFAAKYYQEESEDRF